MAFEVEKNGHLYYPIAILDLAMVDILTSNILMSGIGGCDNIADSVQWCMNREMTILVKQFENLRVIEAFPGDMYEICKENENGFLIADSQRREESENYIKMPLNASYCGMGEPLEHDERFDDNFSERVLDFKKRGLPYHIPTGYYSDYSSPF